MIGVERGDQIIVRHGFIQPMSFGRISFKPPAFSVYPNPSQHVFGVYGTLLQGDDVRIFDAQGRLVWAIRVDAELPAPDPSAEPSTVQRFPIDLSNHAPGIYHLYIQRNNQPLFHINLVLSP